MDRPRLLNARSIYDPAKKFPPARGIPGYNEGDHTYIVGFDVLATQRAAYRAYAHIQQVRQNAELADKYMQKAAAVEKLLLAKWWNQADQCYYAREDGNYHMQGCSAKRASPALSEDWHGDGGSALGEGQLADRDATMARLLDLTHARLEYPEVSYSRIGDIVSKAIGVNLEFSSPLLSAVDGSWVEVTVQTLSGLGTSLDWAEVRNLSIRASEVTIRHEGARKTTFSNQQGPALIWRPTFDGTHSTLLVNGRQVKSKTETAVGGQIVSSARVTVGAGGTVSVEAP